MNIKDIKNKKVKISPHSITCKNGEGKTCGIVKDIRLHRDIPRSKAQECFKIFKESGIWGDSVLMDCIVYHNDELYYLHNLKPIEFYERFFKNADEWTPEKQRYNKRLEVAENLSKVIHVIPCYILY